MRPAVSIIVPVHNVEAYLEKCLDSLINQTFDNYEIIIVNDGSTDRSKEIAERYKDKYSNIVLINQEQKGVGEARNTGIEASKGEYILFVDSDDYIHRDTLKLTYNKSIETQADIVTFGYTVVSESGDTIFYDRGFENTNNTLIQNRELIMCAPIAWNKLFKKEIFINSGIRFLTMQIGEDLNAVLKLYLHAKIFAFVDKSLYFYLKRKGSATNVEKTDRLMEIMDVIDDLYHYYKQHNAYETYKNELDFVAVYHAFYLGSIRVARINHKHPLLLQLRQYISTKVPNYMHQKYLYRLGKSRQIVLKLLDKQHYATISLLLKVKGM